jgi:DNA-binding response OmpR family regulator
VFDLAVLDVMLPGTSGLDLCRQIREQGTIGIIMLTARIAESDRVAGLELGADDYVSKPFSPRELVARVAAVLRRRPPESAGVIIRGPLRIDRAQRRVTLDGRAVELTPSELAMLETLVSRPGHVRSRAQLLEALPQERDSNLERTVDVHIRNLRKKLELDPARPAMIQTVLGSGYRFMVP